MKNSIESREVINFTHDEMFDLWDGTYHDGLETELNGEIYTKVKETRNEYYDDEAYDIVVMRKSDGKCFKFTVAQSEYHGTTSFTKLEEVFPKTITTVIYE